VSNIQERLSERLGDSEVKLYLNTRSSDQTKYLTKYQPSSLESCLKRGVYADSERIEDDN
jgi:hypothetical protein